MKKLKLNLDALTVESFDAGTFRPPLGTVKAHSAYGGCTSLNGCASPPGNSVNNNCIWNQTNTVQTQGDSTCLDTCPADYTCVHTCVCRSGPADGSPDPNSGCCRTYDDYECTNFC